MQFCHIGGASYHWRPAPHALFRLPMACLPPRRCVPSSPLTPHCHLISKKCSGPCVDPPLPPSLLTTYHLPLLPSILAAAFPFAICVLHFYTVFISCDALGGYASPSLSWPFFSSLSLVPSLSLSLSPSLSFSLPLSAFLCSIKSFSLYMVSLIYALQSPFNLPLSSFSATADFMLLRLTSSTWSTSPSNCTCPSHLRPSAGSSGCPSWQARHSPCH